MQIGIPLTLAISYLIGSVPFGVIFSKTMKGKDPRLAGSRNIGFTNVLRVVGAGPAILTLCGDVGKGALAAYLGKYYQSPEVGEASALFAILGHCYPIFLRLQGGKAVATSFGALALLYPLEGVLTFAVWVATVLWSRFVSLGALVAFAFLPLIMAWFHPRWNTILFSLAIAILVYLRHRENISLPLSNKEKKSF